MTPQTLPPKQPATGNNLDTLIQELCQTHGLSAVGKSLARSYGRTKAMQAVLGYLEVELDAIYCTSVAPSVPSIPASIIWARPGMSLYVLAATREIQRQGCRRSRNPGGSTSRWPDCGPVPRSKKRGF